MEGATAYVERAVEPKKPNVWKFEIEKTKARAISIGLAQVVIDKLVDENRGETWSHFRSWVFNLEKSCIETHDLKTETQVLGQY